MEPEDINPALWRQIAFLWKELTAWPPSDVDGAMHRLLDELFALSGATGGALVLSYRLGDMPDDPLLGWRPGALLQHGASAGVGEVGARWGESEASFLDDPYTRLGVEQPTQHRVVHSQDLLVEGQEGGAAEALMEALGVGDRLMAAHATTPDCQVFFVLDRGQGAAPFDDADKAAVLATLSGLDALCERYILSHGITHLVRPLSPRLRETLLHLLTGSAEKEIAAQMGLTPRSLHQYVVEVYRRFGVNSRAELMWLWLGGARPGPANR